MVQFIKQQSFFVFFAFGLLALIFGAVLLGFAANEIYFLRSGDDAPVVTVVVPEGATQDEIGSLLAEAELISSPLLFKLYAAWRGADTRFQKGTFAIVRGSSLRRIVNQLLVSEADEERVTLLEGWTIRDMGKYLEDAASIPEEEYRAAACSPIWRDEFEFLKEAPGAPGACLEGFLFPDTYRIFANASAAEVVRKQLENFEERVGVISYADLILASIIEREVRGERDRRVVADIFRRRQSIGMALQADSTVNYVTGKNLPAISREDTLIASPYNTYKYRDLPPAPISNPGLESINAVRDPLPNDFLYFLTDTAGTVHYGRTLEEHNANKARYLK